MTHLDFKTSVGEYEHLSVVASDFVRCCDRTIAGPMDVRGWSSHCFAGNCGFLALGHNDLLRRTLNYCRWRIPDIDVGVHKLKSMLIAYIALEDCAVVQSQITQNEALLQEQEGDVGSNQCFFLWKWCDILHPLRFRLISLSGEVPVNAIILFFSVPKEERLI